MRASSPSPSSDPGGVNLRYPRGVLVDGAVVVGLLAMVGLLAAAGRVPAGDGTHLAALTLEVSDALRDGELGRAALTWFTRVAPQPPAGFLPGIVATSLVGERWLAMLLVGAFALWVCWDALKRLADGAIPWAPALVVVASPMVWLAVAQYGWDLSTAAATLQCVSWLHRSDGLRAATPDGRRAAAWFGAWMGLGFLTKYTFPMFLWLPCLLAGLGIAAGPDRAARLRGLGRALLVFTAIVGPWLLVNGGTLAAYLGRSVGEGAIAAVDASRAGANRFSAEALALYPLSLKDALGWPGVLVLGFVGVAALSSWGRGAAPPRNAPPDAVGAPGSSRRSRLGGPALALSAALGGLFVLSSLEQSQDRYALPALVALATLALPIARLPWGQEVFVGVFAVQLVGTIATFRPGAPTYEPRFDHDLATAAAMSWPVTRSYRPTHVDLAAWHVDEALRTAAEAAGAAPIALVIPDDPRLPEPGVYLMRAAQLDLAPQLVIARPRPDAPPVSNGGAGGWPGPEVGAAYVVWAPGHDRATEAWLAGAGRARLATFELPGGRAGAVLK